MKFYFFKVSIEFKGIWHEFTNLLTASSNWGKAKLQVHLMNFNTITKNPSDFTNFIFHEFCIEPSVSRIFYWVRTFKSFLNCRIVVLDKKSWHHILLKSFLIKIIRKSRILNHFAAELRCLWNQNKYPPKSSFVSK